MLARSIVTAAMVLGAASVACAQLADGFQNPSFELGWGQANPPRNPSARPGGIFGFSNNSDPQAQSRQIGDGLLPAAIARTGTKSAGIGPVEANGFNGYTTDTLDSLPPNFTFLYYDLPLDWNAGDIEFSIWWATRADSAPIDFPNAQWPADGGDFVWPDGFAPGGFRLDIKGAGSGFQNNATFDSWDRGFRREITARNFLFAGNTNGQWRQSTLLWPARTSDRQGWKDLVEDNAVVGNYSLPPAGTTPNPPVGQIRFPDRIKFTFGRFNPTPVPSTGTVFLDDWSLVQRPAGPALCGPADIAGEGGAAGGDGVLDNNDFIVYIGYFFAGDPLADVGSEGGAAGSDGNFDNNDFIVFISQFFGGC
jgi:hypothetical protein